MRKYEVGDKILIWTNQVYGRRMREGILPGEQEHPLDWPDERTSQYLPPGRYTVAAVYWRCNGMYADIFVRCRNNIWFVWSNESLDYCAENEARPDVVSAIGALSTGDEAPSWRDVGGEG